MNERLSEDSFDYVDVEGHPMLIVRIKPTDQVQKLWDNKKYDESDSLFQEQYQEFGKQLIINQAIVEKCHNLVKRMNRFHGEDMKWAFGKCTEELEQILYNTKHSGGPSND